ncbi:MAG: tRNA uridine-5-carboxymethylaminomethyl(34) synthesis GTPase MnmE [Candidatus Marinimicrobia bacterium]|nr:tRNA uridine-5-carboxymethylaminomethyl(34) synthesis GTPase MnmE [Candidatus Neomarinimicrobiota bacterium]
MVPYDQETIVALATPPGVGALSVLRISGESLVPFYKQLTKTSPKTRFAAFCKLHHPETGEVLDEVVATYFKSPKSFTGEDMIEISCHGGEVVQNNIIAAILDGGARLAKPGEFSFRAYMNGKMDLLQAEAVASLIASKSTYSTKVGLYHLDGRVSRQLMNIKSQVIDLLAVLENELNFSEEEIDVTSLDEIASRIKLLRNEVSAIVNASSFGRQIFSGVRVVLFGKPNSGKSSLFNALLGYDRAIVSSTPGTTRDTVEAWIELEGLPVCLIDTAGMWESGDYLDNLGIAKTKSELDKADLCLLVDEDDPTLIQTDHMKIPVILIRSKCDIDQQVSQSNGVVRVSSKTQLGIKDLLTHLSTYCTKVTERSENNSFAVMTTRRQRTLLGDAHGVLSEALKQTSENIGTDIVASTLRQFIVCVQDMVGEIPNENIMETVFSEFCIGK